jgi:hypothetical protein
MRTERRWIFLLGWSRDLIEVAIFGAVLIASALVLLRFCGSD